MKTLEELFSGLLDIVEHVVGTHVAWNETMTQDGAKQLIAECRIGLAQDSQENSADAPPAVPAEKSGE